MAGIPSANDQRGAAALEFALLLYPLLILLFGIMEFGWYFTHRIVLTNAVSAAARAGIKAEDPQTTEQYAVGAARNAYWLGDIPRVQVAVENGPPKMLSVVVPPFQFQPLVGFLPPTLLPRRLAAKAVLAFP
jgi:Flp pilus assembly protein TadG